jgi:hypothetical protein
MADLASYIKQQLQAGYDINSVRTALLKYGYSQMDIDSAIRQVYGPQPTEVRHVIHLSPAVIAIAVVFIVVVGGILSFSLIPKGAPKQLMDLKTEITSTIVYAGEALRFNVEALNLGSEGRYDIQLRYLISDSAGKTVKTKEETVALDTRVSTSGQITLPSNLKAGSYQLKVIANYEGATATATENFMVYSRAEPTPTEPTIPEPIEPTPGQISCDDGDSCTRDTLVGDDCSHEPIIPCCGNGNCESTENFEICPVDCPPPAEDDPFAGMSLWETLDKVDAMALTRPKEAAQHCSDIEDQDFKDKCFARVGKASNNEVYCNGIVDEREKDKCLRDVSKSTDNVALCDRIVSDATRDSCYMDAVTKGNYDICDKITNHYHKTSCETLKKYDVQLPAR